MKKLAYQLTMILILAAGCRTDRQTRALPELDSDMGWYTRDTVRNPNSMVDYGLNITLYLKGADASCHYFVNGRDYTSWSHFTNVVTLATSTGADTGTFLDASGGVSTLMVKKTISFLHERNQKHIVLFGMLECVDSPTMKEEIRERQKEIESNKPQERTSQ